MRRIISSALLCAVAALSGSCKLTQPRTQVMLIIHADATVRELANQLQVDIEGRDAADQIDGPPSTYTFQPKEPSSTGWPFSIALVPRTRELQRSYRVTAMVSDGNKPIAVLRAQGIFAAQKTLALRLYLTEDCLEGASLNCANVETCQLGSCVSATVEPATLPNYEVGSIEVGEGAAEGGDTGLGTDDLPAMMTDTSQDAAVVSTDGMPQMTDPGVMQGDAGALGLQPGDCGDGMLNQDELCDTGIAQGDGACPTECTTQGCMSGLLEGTGCQTKCVTSEITAIASGDGCCPMGADSTVDSDCVVQCGNGKVESGETCESGDPRQPCPTPDSCHADTCLIATLTGDAALCTAECSTQVIEQCVAGDGCCPSMCTHDLDKDCSASCGNGVVDSTAGETCDTTSAETPCPTACDDGDVCTRDFLTGSAATCSTRCSYIPIVAPLSGDGCCPDGANANSDLDCMAICGNAVVERGELCDSNCPRQSDCDDGRYCTTDELTGRDCTLACRRTEVRNPRDGDYCCPSGANANNDSDCDPQCGNGVRESGEECDGDCPTRCAASGSACVENILTGAPCHIRCTPRQVTAARDDDGCCPSGATSDNDNDCKPVQTCGNGLREGDEICDGACPVCPPSANACISNRSVNSPDACHPRCVPTPHGPSGKTSDRCCPDGATASNDIDCGPTCGNGMTETGEVCDGDCGVCAPRANPCETVQYVDNNNDRCHPSCEISLKGPSGRSSDRCCPSGATASNDIDCGPTCGNGMVETGEVCDGDCGVCAPRANPCEMARYTDNNNDKCHPSCEIFMKGPSGEVSDRCCPSGISEYQDKDCPPYCGNGKVESGEECDSTASSCQECVFIGSAPPKAD